jgi:hypothetical protein
MIKILVLIQYWYPRASPIAAGPRASPRREKILPEPWFKRKFDGWTANSAVYMCKFYMHILLAKQRGKTALVCFFFWGAVYLILPKNALCTDQSQFTKNVFSVSKKGAFFRFSYETGRKNVVHHQYVGPHFLLVSRCKSWKWPPIGRKIGYCGRKTTFSGASGQGRPSPSPSRVLGGERTFFQENRLKTDPIETGAPWPSAALMGSISRLCAASLFFIITHE